MSKDIAYWKSLYNLQDEVLDIFSQSIQSASLIYFGGGTALSRYYLNHRLSEDLDFFADNIFQFLAESQIITKTNKRKI